MTKDISLNVKIITQYKIKTFLFKYLLFFKNKSDDHIMIQRELDDEVKKYFNYYLNIIKKIIFGSECIINQLK